ncbi:uncharacterized protein LOC134264851 [Saccostrea cucullata]|uniref:uncharacterized protein LOC134264851 n=1 Tax=Saccostrea cuccullata TaxID=36930 RepID=UPI002ED4A2AC
MNSMCNQVCSSGFYGRDCLQNCSGHCYGNKTCDPVDGTCKICAEEYIGKKCDKLKKREHRLRNSDHVPLAVIVGVPTSVIALVAIAVTCTCYRRRSLKSLENSQATRSDENLKESEFTDDSHQYETLNFSQKHI